ncbi:lytic transglycosylase [Pseudomonas sp. N040]|uniref:lytic transglycosylase n=1 Tax=Pseudomonas sp. N040 TaxID=2785325 RepID=UPI0018A28C8F|nr:LysM peptidoglycan-binding domain-containing protein [Pseudomonas sp. N040]MBF7730700.1 LysM peptidoglycan-binding domain-containing protein [Pseudomonas sp. N040]MBW7014343.1 LysM peptidoglycan-binding domain-containing protein [Pseudomonas sp. N040]
MPSIPRTYRDLDALARSARGVFIGSLLLLGLAGCQTTQQSSDGDASRETDPAIGLEADIPVLVVEEEPEDIWERIREGYKLQDQVGTNPRIERQRLWFASRPNIISSSAERGSPYIHFVVEQLDENNMPLELALLPVIESSYNPMAYSRSSAAGIWQFIPSTGRHFNLQQTSWYDGRRDISASTNAAILYLNRLHDMFNGDWLLALAAYNAGEGTVSRAIERNQRIGLPTDYWNLQLPKETEEYVPKLLAVSQIVLSPDAYGVELPEVANEPYFEAVAFSQRMQLSSVAKIADIDEDELLMLNPAFKKGVTLGGPQQLLVPVAMADQFETNLALYKPQKTIDWQEYRVRPGDSLHGIANRYYLTVNTLKDINGLKSNHLRVGQVLSIPADPAHAQAAPLYEARPGKAPASRQYVVRKGDNLGLIARKNGVAVADIKRWNNLRSTNLKIGQVLKLQGGSSGLAVKTSSSGKSQAASGAPTARPTTYKVRSGDTLYQIASRFRVDLKQLQKWNPAAGKNLQVGQKLTIYTR